MSAIPDVKIMLSRDEQLTPAERSILLDRLHQLERDIATIQHEVCVARRDRDALLTLIANDGHAMSFQSLGQYRAALSLHLAHSSRSQHD